MSQMAMEVLRGVLTSDYRGPKAIFGEVHVLKALMVIGNSGSVGRGRLSSLVGLGQGEIRTLIKRLKEKELITIDADGCRLSKTGREEYQLLTRLLPWSSEVRAAALGMGEKCWAVLVRKAGRKVRLGIEQRDAAVRAGANGALTAIFRSGHFTLPGEGTDCETSGPVGLWSTIRASRPEGNDVVVIAGSQDTSTAEWGALAAALTLV